MGHAPELFPNLSDAAGHSGCLVRFDKVGDVGDVVTSLVVDIPRQGAKQDDVGSGAGPEDCEGSLE